MLKRFQLSAALFLVLTFFGGMMAASAQDYPPGPPPGYGPPHGYRSGYYSGRRIIHAVYGAKGRYADVTGIVRRLARNGVPFRVSNETFGIDPYKGKPKQLRVVMVRPDGEQFERRWSEGDRVRL